MPPTVVAVEQAKAFRNIICIYGIAANLRAPWIAVLIFCVPPKAAVTVVVAFPSSCWGGTSKLYSWPPAVPASTQPQNSFSGFSGGGGRAHFTVWFFFMQVAIHCVANVLAQNISAAHGAWSQRRVYNPKQTSRGHQLVSACLSAMLASTSMVMVFAKVRQGIRGILTLWNTLSQDVQWPLLFQAEKTEQELFTINKLNCSVGHMACDAYNPLASWPRRREEEATVTSLLWGCYAFIFRFSRHSLLKVTYNLNQNKSH